jgi:hypothetical protein
MPNVTPEAIKQLATRYEEACKHLKTSVAHSSPADSEFYQIIHKGGWTTLIDVERANTVLDAFEHQTKAAAATNKALVDGARSALTKTASA